MESSNQVRLHATIEGRVQGVGFRFFVLDIANELDLTGWVRNTVQGNVEVLAEGSRQNLTKLLGYLQKGPRAAYVTEVRHNWQDASGEFNRFDVQRTV